MPEFVQRLGELRRGFIADDKQSRSTACNLKSKCNAGLAECLFLNGRPPSVVLSKAIDGSFLDPAFSTFLEQQQPRVDTMSIPGFFWQAMIHSPASIPIGNETYVTGDIIFRHCTTSLTDALLSTDLFTIASTDN